MSLPRIRKDFKSIGRTTDNAIQFIDFDGKDYWIPRSICTLIKEKEGSIIATLAAFKFEEITNIKVEPLTTAFASLGGEIMPHHKTNCEIIESETTPLKTPQRKRVEQLIKSKYMALLCDAGTGKTLMSLTVAYSRLKSGLINHIIVLCPASLQKQWKELAKEYYPDIDISVYSIHSASYTDSLERIKKDFYNKIGSIQLIVDEVHLCFPYKELVLTDIGELPIGYIVDNKIRCNVLSYNIYAEKVEQKEIIDYICIENIENIVEINLINGVKLQSTESHLIFTKNGYKEAKKLSNRDYVQVVRENSFNSKKGKNYCNFLFSKLCKQLPIFFSKKQGQNEKRLFRKIRISEMFIVRYRILCEKISKAKVLFSKVRCFFKCTKSRSTKENKGKVNTRKSIGNNERKSQKISSYFKKCFIKNEKIEPYEKQKDEGKSKFKIKRNWAQTKNKRWKWLYNKITTNIIRYASSWRIYIGICYKYKRYKRQDIEYSKQLQSRYSNSISKNSDRNRWKFSQYIKNARKGLKKRKSFEYVRVESIKIIEQGNNRKQGERISKVYCIDVADNNNFYANKILVHNCRNQSAKRSRNIEKSFDAEYCMILTGFPIERNAGDLFYQFGIMGREILGCENYGQFQKSFLLLGGDDGEKVVAYRNTKELAERINPYIVRLTKKEVAPELPEKHYHEVYFDMNQNQLKAYQAINGLIGQYKFLPKNKQYQLGTFSQKLAAGYSPTDSEIESIFGNLGKLGDGADNVAKIGGIGFDSQNNRIKAFESLINQIEGQCIIWCNFVDEMHAIKDILPNSEIINGENIKERDSFIDRFKSGNLKYLIISIAINEGFNLQCCNNEIFYSDNYSRTKAENAADRCHRIGQIKEVHIYKLIARNSLDERIKKVRERKSIICNIFNDSND